MKTAKQTIRFVGLGIMGTPMATHLANAGHKLIVFDVSESRIEPLLLLGAEAGQSCRDVAERCEVVISMVPDSPDVEKVYLSTDGVLAGVKPGMAAH